MKIKMLLIGAAAGGINAIFGAGGGMVLVPLLSGCQDLEESDIFSSSVAIILPICVISLFFTALHEKLPWFDALPYLLGSIPGGIFAGRLEKKIPAKWLHRVLGLLIIWGGVQYLC